ncbi:MAG: dihydrolipoamide acetyltransferase, partial [Verrucomicrobiales bacterium]|nr:dihydrolipoamide acetyltransferase [Verrucomicrobiales bacterium]
MPKLSDTMSEGTLVKWLKKEGDTVSMDEDIAEVETDKATMTMPSFDEGILYRIYVKEGETVVLGASLALILEPGEEPPADADQAPSSASAADPAEDKAEKPVAEKAEAAAPAPAAAKSPP